MKRNLGHAGAEQVQKAQSSGIKQSLELKWIPWRIPCTVPWVIHDSHDD